MTKEQAVQQLNSRIDKLILEGKTDTEEYKRLCRLHYKFTH